jgi:nitrous oxidase accessory protein
MTVRPRSAAIRAALGAAAVLAARSAAAAAVASAADLAAALSRAASGDVVRVAAGRIELERPIDVPAGVALTGAGVGRTVLTHAPGWRAAAATLPDPETDVKAFDRSGYLIRCADKAGGIAISGMTLTGPQVHGAVFGSGNRGLHLHDLRIEDFMYCGIRTYGMTEARIHDCVFIDAGRRWQKGEPGLGGGITGGGIFAVWMADCEIWNNRFVRTRTAPDEHFYGLKGRQARRCRIHHNTIGVNFSIELPFENDEDVEIDHNVLLGTVSIPKHAGGPVPPGGRTFHIHHNLFRDSYAIEFVRNGVEIDHNLFDFDPAKDHGNAISAFGKAPAAGPARFHHNLVSNPGRGVIWMNEPYARLDVCNNHIIARPTVTPRTDGLFGFHRECGFDTFRFVDNIVECIGPARPLFRNDESGRAAVENNRLVNVGDTHRYANPAADRPVGPAEPLRFRCGVNGEFEVDGWTVRAPPAAASATVPGRSPGGSIGGKGP